MSAENTPRRFVIDGITLQAFEQKEGKIFIEFRGEPPRFPIFVQEITGDDALEKTTVARNPSDTWNE
jgi:hypothetical protein